MASRLLFKQPEWHLIKPFTFRANNMNKILFSFFLPLSMALSVSAADHQLELAVPFTDNMILQRESKVPIWGFDAPGNRVTVEFAGQRKTAVADKNGDWMVKLDPLKASREEQGLEVKNNRGKSISLKGVLVGEVWFSSGQSNMVWTAGKSMCNELARELASSKEDIPIREINISTVSALYPQKKGTSEGGWKKASAASGFSALSLSFAYELYKELNVPIGIVLSAHSNTRIEAFTQREAIEAHPKLKTDADLIHDADPLTAQGRNAFVQYYSDLKVWQDEAGRAAEAGGKVPARPNLPGIAGMWRGPSQFYNGKIAPVIPYAIRGAIWCQGTSNGGDGRIYAARMEALVKGWRDAWGMPEMPFYFTQMQCYGAPDPNNVGFADIRQVQHLFFKNNRQNVGMVVQSDLNSARPGGIHYYNKLHPGMRMARWALAKQYGKDTACTGPIYSGCKVDGRKVVVSFDKESLFGGLMVGNKGMAKDYRESGKFVEPARPTPSDKLNHFRVCGADKKWHAAEAVIVGDTVVVSSGKVPAPIGVQYAYSAVPENSNLYNKAGLPATPFAEIDGKLIFEEDDLEKAAALKAKYAQYTDPNYPILQVAEYYRDGVILQRNHPIQVWGHANRGVKVTVTLDGVTQSVSPNDLEQWSVTFPARKASSKPITLEVKSSHGFNRTVRNILVGDVWYLTGSTLLSTEWAYDRRDKEAELPNMMPLVREFCRKTSASAFATPRKRRFETGGGKYRSHWLSADYSKEGHGVTMFAYEFAKALNRPGIPQGFITMSSGQGGRNRQLASPLSWTSFQGVSKVDNPVFKTRLDELFLQFPNSGVAKKAAASHLEEVKVFTQSITAAGKRGADPSSFALKAPSFPEAGKGGTVPSDTIPTYAYNWCVSPLTPMGVAGVIWVPSESNLGEDPAHYAAELEIYAKSLPGTHDQDNVQFLFAQPASSLVEGITAPRIPGAKSFSFDQWPKSLQRVAIQLGELIRSKRQ
jgi:sialate O-acetylesterase